MKATTTMKIVVAAMVAMVMLLPVVVLAEPQQTIEQLKFEQAVLQAKLDQAEQKSIPATLSRFAGFGKELGEAFNGFITALDGGMQVTSTSE